METVTKDKRDNSLLIMIIASIVAILAIIADIDGCNRKVGEVKSQQNLINALYDTLVTLRKNIAASTTVEMAALQMETAKQFIDLKIKDSQIVDLQKMVSEYKNKLKAGSSVTNTTVKTEINKTTPNDTIGSSDIIFSIDSNHYNRNNLVIHGNNIIPFVLGYNKKVPFADVINYNPYFESRYSDKWIDYDIKTYVDSTNFKLSIINKYAIVLGYNKKVPFADVINYNPYSKVTVLRTFQVSVPKQKSWGIGFSTGIGLSYDLRPRPYIGVGVNYNIIKF
jgi:hypothetical protein